MRRFLVLSALLVAFTGFASAAAVNQVSYGSLTVTGSIDFSAFNAAVGSPASVFNSVVSLGGASFAERFAGQTLSFNGDFDVLDNVATNPLTLVAGAANQNVGLGSQFIWGNGQNGGQTANGIGEGAVSVLFDADTHEVGFQVGGDDGGTGTAIFFARDGSLIHSITFNLVGPGSFYGFRRDGNVMDIAGVSLINFNGGGVWFDNFLFKEASSVPEPTTLFLLGSGLLGLCLLRRRK